MHTWQENLDLRSYSDSIIIKDVRSDERLLDEVSLFLHRVVAKMPEKKRQVITSLHDTDALLRGKKVLLVDDDMSTKPVVKQSEQLMERAENEFGPADTFRRRAVHITNERLPNQFLSRRAASQPPATSPIVLKRPNALCIYDTVNFIVDIGLMQDSRVCLATTWLF
jgi:hypothetical protein